MNYSKIYKDLTTRGQQDRDLGYTEYHHIIPKCMGGTDDASNISILTPEEHYIAHLLLVKMYPSNDKLVFAANMMTVASPKSQARHNNKRHGWLRRLNAEAQRNRIFSDETKQKMSESALKREKVKCPHCGKEGSSGNMNRWHFDNCKHGPTPLIFKHTDEYKANMRKTFAEKKPVQNSEQIKCDHCDYVGLRCVVNATHNDYCKTLANPKTRTMKLITCPHCGKEGRPVNMHRWHLDNCKHKVIQEQ